MIPKTVWQTYRTSYSELPDYALRAAETWQTMNPEWEYRYMSDADVEDFVRDHFGPSFIEIFKNKCPVGVMRADIWRVMVLYIYGGMYTDLDTVCCVPIEAWIQRWEDKRVILNAEHEIHINQWTFLSEPNHPILGHILERMEAGLQNPDYTNEHFVHQLTGPGVFTKSILEFLELWDNNEYIRGEVYKSDPWAKQNMHGLDLVAHTEIFNNAHRSKEYGVFLVPSHRFFHNEVSKHLYGSQSWSDGNYVQWIKERENFVN